jgi:PTH2 family peptidyl-tRNA hydrolase
VVVTSITQEVIKIFQINLFIADRIDLTFLLLVQQIMWETHSKELLIGLGVVVCTGVCLKLAHRTSLFSRLLTSQATKKSSSGFNLREKMKMTLVVRDDLKMGKGKIAAQCAHAALEGYLQAIRSQPELVRRWIRSGQMKIVVKAKDEQELMQLHQTCKSRGVSSCVIQDAGHTQVDPGTRTVLCIGPAPSSIISEISGHLKLM